MTTIYIAISLINCITTFSLGSYVYIKKRTYLYYFLFNINHALWNLFYALYSITDNYGMALFFSRCLMISVSLIPSLYIFYCYEISEKKQPQKIKIVTILIGLFFVLISLTPLMINNVSPILGFSYWPRAGILFPLWLIWFFILTIFGHIMLIRQSYHDKRYLYILVGIYLGFFGGGANFLLFYNIPFPPIFNGFISIYVILTTWAILKHDVLGVTFVIKRWTAHAIIFLFIIASFLIANLTLGFDKQLLIFALTFLGLFWAYATYPAIRFLITTRARKFLKGWYLPEDVLTSISNNIEKEKSKRKIFSSIAEEIFNALEIENIGLVIARRDKNKALSHYLVTDRNINELGQLELNDIIIDYFTKNPKIIRFKELIKILEKEHTSAEIETELAKLKNFGFSGKETYFLPFSAPEIFEGLIIANQKSEGKPFKDKDITLFNLIIKQVENFFYKLTPYEVIEAKYFETKEKLHNAEIQLIRSKKIEAIVHATRQCHHEVKTPLSIIRMTLNELPDLAEIKKPKQEMIEEIDRAVEITNETLKLTDGASTNQVFRMVDVNHAINRATKLIPQYKSFTLNLNLADDLPKIKAILEDIEILFTNLINNALEAMGSGGTITIASELLEKSVQIKVSDTGKGIPPELITRIWEPYVSGTPTDAGNSTGGRGWGLTIVNRIIQDHNGTINVESEVGKGTTFIITLPIES